MNFDQYFFPDESIALLSDSDLHDLIRSNLKDALSQCDGTDPNAGVRIDYCQDIIEQARDLLVERGYVFDEEYQASLKFLSWPLTEAEIQQKAIDDAAKAALGKIESEYRYRSCDMMRAVFSRLLSNCIHNSHDILLLTDKRIDLQHWELQISSSVYNSFSGAEIFRIKSEFEAVPNLTVEFSWGCFMVGVTDWKLLQASKFYWSFRFRLNREPQFFTLLKTHFSTAKDINVVIWDYQPDSPLQHRCYEDVKDLLKLL